MKKRKLLNTNVFFGFLAFASFLMFLTSFLFVGVGKTVFLSLSAFLGILIPLYDFWDRKKTGILAINPLLYAISVLAAFILISPYQGLLLLLIYAGGIVGKELTAHTKINAESAMKTIKQKKYHLYIDGERTFVDPKNLKPGDKAELLSGELVPVDCTVLSGEATVTATGIDGTSKIFTVHRGARLIAGMTVLSGCVVVRVENDLQNSTTARIVGYKSKLVGTVTKHEKQIIRIVNIASAVVWAAGFVLLTVSAVRAKNPSGISYACIWMCLVCCTDSFRFLLHNAYLNAAMRCCDNGIIVKNKRLVEKSMYIKNLLFRKQGVLTERSPVVSKIIPIDGVSENELINFAVYAQFKASHPISAELCAEYGKRVKLNEIAYFMETDDNGAMVQLKNGIEVITGSAKVLNSYGIVSGIISEESVLCVAVNNVFIGHIVFEYPIKEDIKQYVDSLKYAGAKNLSIVTKDSERAAKAIAAKSGVKRYFSELTSETLEQTVNSFGKNTVYVGFGKGDSYTFGDDCTKLMYGGFQYDCPSTDGLLLSDSLGCVLKYFNIIKETRALMVENLVLSAAATAVTVLLMLHAPAAVWAGGLAIVLGSWLCSLNTFRMFKKL